VIEMKVLQGYVENRTKEAALAAMLIALFFVTRTYKVQVVPGFAGIDFSGAVIFTAASMLSWPYIFIFTLANIYNVSNIFLLAFVFSGSQVVFFLSKSVGEKWAPHIPAFGQIGGLPLYLFLMHVTGLIDFRVYLAVCAVPLAIYISTNYVGGLLIWKVVKGFGIIGEVETA